MRSLWITGASGFLGWYACQALSHDWQLYGTYHTHPVTLEKGAVESLDLRDNTAVQAYWDKTQPDAVLHTAAISKAGPCQRDPDGSYPVNVTSAVTLAQRCAKAAIPFVFTSTDLVFDGTQAPYEEGDRPNPVNHYGHQKAVAEQAILRAYPDATICRLPLMYGAATPTATCFLQSFLATLQAGTPLTLFTDEVRTPAEVTDVVQGLRLVLAQNVTGLLHLGGPQRLNRYDFGRLMAIAFQMPTTALQPCLQSSVPLSAPRPQDVSLNSERAFALGYTPRFPAEALTHLTDTSAQ